MPVITRSVRKLPKSEQFKTGDEKPLAGLVPAAFSHRKNENLPILSSSKKNKVPGCLGETVSFNRSSATKSVRNQDFNGIQ